MQIFRYFFVVLISQSLLFAPIIHAADLTLSSSDITAPEISHSPVKAVLSGGESVSISATITDNSGVKEAVLFYREIGASQFKRLQMGRQIGGDIYLIMLPAIQPPGIEYYIQATDAAGNSLLRGHSFSPLTVKVTQPAPVVAETEPSLTTEMAKKEEGTSMWVWVGLGALAVGVLAVAAGGGGGGGGDDEPAATTGTVTISGPAPN